MGARADCSEHACGVQTSILRSWLVCGILQCTCACMYTCAAVEPAPARLKIICNECVYAVNCKVAVCVCLCFPVGVVWAHAVRA
jgi:hypothetical protein